MAYTFFYYYFPVDQPYLSRIKASAFNGTVCPTSISYGLVHGTQPARATVTFKGAYTFPLGQQQIVQVGQSVYYGLSIKTEIAQSNRDGNLTTVMLVDCRDRLADVNIFGQFNMTNQEGVWWHLMPWEWQDQRKIFVKALEDSSDVTRQQSTTDLNNNEADKCVPMLSAATILNYLCEVFFFTYTGSPQAIYILETCYPENLDWNAGKKVIDAVQEICDQCNIQFSATGNLVLHFSVPGFPENTIEQQFMSGNINLCQYQGYVEASLGGELNEKGRRVIVIGDQNKEENWYPCIPDWNEKWDLDLVDQVGPKFTALLKQYNLTALDQVKSLPSDYHDPYTWRDGKRDEMSIKEYVEKIPFKVYRVDFGMPLAGVPGLGINGESFDSLKDADNEKFVFDTYLANLKNPDNPYNSRFSEYPIATELCSNSDTEFYTVATTRKLWKGTTSTKQMLKGERIYVDEGVTLEVDEYIYANVQKNGENFKDEITDYDCRMFRKVRIIYDERRYIANAISEEKLDTETGQMITDTSFTFDPDHIYARIALLTEKYNWQQGEPTFVSGSPNPRVRETVYPIADLHKNYVDFYEVPLIVQNYLQYGFVNTIYPDQIAAVAAARLLNHEIVINAGFVTYRNSAGSTPSGIFESINVTFNATTGVQEVVNFTNVFHDNKMPYFYPIPRVKTKYTNESEAVIKDEQKDTRNALKEFQKHERAARQEDEVNERNASTKFGDSQTVIVSIESINYDDDILNGDVIVIS